MKTIEFWFVVLTLFNLFFFTLGMMFLIPKNTLKRPWGEYQRIIRYHSAYIFIIILFVCIHLIEVNVIDSYVTQFIGYDFTPAIQSVEDGIVYWFSQHWTLPLLVFFVFIYIVLYPFTLWFSLLYFLIADEKKAMKTFAYAFMLIYTITLPFYLFLPITNVYVHYGLQSALNVIIPDVEQFFYAPSWMYAITPAAFRYDAGHIPVSGTTRPGIGIPAHPGSLV